MPAPRFNPRRSPSLSASVLIESGNEGADALIAGEHHDIIHEDRRRPHAVNVVERTEWPAPEFLAPDVVGQQPVIGEEEKDSFAVGRGRGRRRMVPWIEFLLPA